MFRKVAAARVCVDLAVAIEAMRQIEPAEVVRIRTARDGDQTAVVCLLGRRPSAEALNLAGRACLAMRHVEACNDKFYCRRHRVELVWTRRDSMQPAWRRLFCELSRWFREAEGER